MWNEITSKISVGFIALLERATGDEKLRKNFHQISEDCTQAEVTWCSDNELKYFKSGDKPKEYIMSLRTDPLTCLSHLNGALVIMKNGQDKSGRNYYRISLNKNWQPVFAVSLDEKASIISVYRVDLANSKNSQTGQEKIFVTFEEIFSASVRHQFADNIIDELKKFNLYLSANAEANLQLVQKMASVIEFLWEVSNNEKELPSYFPSSKPAPKPEMKVAPKTTAVPTNVETKVEKTDTPPVKTKVKKTSAKTKAKKTAAA